MNSLIEVIGLIATLLVFISFLPKNVLFIRVVNLLGSVFFVIYGFNIGAFWTGFLNAVLIIVHSWHIVKILKERRYNADK